MASGKRIYARGQRLWGRLKDERGKWISRPTPYCVGDEDNARRFIAAAQKSLNARRPAAKNGPPTVTEFADAWLKQRKTTDLRSVRDDEGRIRNHVLPRIGKMPMPDVRPKHIRDMVRDLRKNRDLSARTIRNIYGITHAMFREAKIDEVVNENPCQLKRDDLPAKVDKDPEWRSAATYAIDEVKQLISDVKVPRIRRVQYALKALAGLRHGEVAGLRWRNYDATLKPLGLLVVASSYDTGRTKTEVTRRVPVHPVLAAELAAWRAERDPKPDDLIVSTRAGRTVSAHVAGLAMRGDLERLELRMMAGKKRRRGGHDLRAWFITTCQECGAHRDILRVITHTSKSDVMSGYTRVTWPAMCAEIAKLRY